MTGLHDSATSRGTAEAASCSLGGPATQCLTKYNYMADCLDAGFSGYCAPIGDPSLILTESGIGYRLVAPAGS